MSFVGGDILEIAVSPDDQTIGNFRLFPKAGEEGKYMEGGFHTEDDEGSLTSSGEMIEMIKNSRWSFEVTCAWDMNERKDYEKSRLVSSSPGQANITITHSNGIVHVGRGKVVGNTEGSGNATFSVKFAGGQQLKAL